MATGLLMIGWLLLAAYDAVHTERMLAVNGVATELNPVIPVLARRYGLRTGIWAGIFGPTLVILILGAIFPALLVLLLPLRGFLFGLQIGLDRKCFCLPKKISRFFLKNTLIRVS